MKALYKSPIVIIIIIITVGVFIYLNKDFPALDLSKLTPTNIIAVLGYLSLIILIVEQFIEIFVNDPKESDKIKSKNRIEEINVELNNTDLSTELKAEIQKEKNEIENLLIQKGLKRKQRILIINYGIGLILAFSGFRILSGFLFDGSLQNGTEAQQIMIQSIDIILTAGIISGGSDRVHRLLKKIKANFSES